MLDIACYTARMSGLSRMAVLAVIVAPITACSANGGRYPSLELRPAERMTGAFVPVPPTEGPAPMPEGTLGRLGALEASARAAHARFVEQAPAARALVTAGRGADASDNRWSAAQVALADLDGIRSETAVVLGDIDLMFVDATLADSDRVAIERSRQAIVALITQEDAVLAELRGDAP